MLHRLALALTLTKKQALLLFLVLCLLSSSFRTIIGEKKITIKIEKIK